MPRRGESKAKIIDILDANPSATNMEIAEAINLSKARVSQIRIELHRPQGRRRKQGVAPVSSKRNWLGMITTQVILDKVKQIVRR